MWRGELSSCSSILTFIFTFNFLCMSAFLRTGMAGVPGTASGIFGAVKDVGANVIMISQVYSSLHNSIYPPHPS